jgi:hypothetical protein
VPFVGVLITDVAKEAVGMTIDANCGLLAVTADIE